MKIYLDDIRVAPRGWIQTVRPDETIRWLETGEVTDLSLDHDLGDETPGDGYDVLVWLEEAVIVRGFIPPSNISVHSGNPVGRDRMEAAIRTIQDFRKQFPLGR